MYVTCVPTCIYNRAIYSGFIFIARTAVMQIYTEPLNVLKAFSIWRARVGKKGTQRKWLRISKTHLTNLLSLPGVLNLLTLRHEVAKLKNDTIELQKKSPKISQCSK